MKMKNTIAIALVAIGITPLLARAQDSTNDTPPADAQQQQSPGEHGGPRAHGGFHLLPPRAAERLNLTDDQKQQVAALEADTKAKLEKILTADQMRQLNNMRPPMRQGGPGGGSGNGGPDGQGGPGGGGPGNGGQGNDGPQGPPPGN